MPHRFFILLTSLISLLSSVCAQATESVTVSEIDWQPWSKEIFIQAKTENKLVLLDLMAEWCHFCKEMDATTYHDKQVVENIKQHYIPVRVDRDKNRMLAKRYARYGTPSTIVYNHKGEEVIKRTGYIKPQFMYWMLQAVADDPSPDAHR